jgi:acyl-CoA synthetase (NDP forming)
VLVEALRDVVFRLAPLAREDARDMMASIRGARLLGEFRGEPGVDRRAVEETLCRLAQLADDFPELAEIDVNPLVCRPSGAIALDARVRIMQPGLVPPQ